MALISALLILAATEVSFGQTLPKITTNGGVVVIEGEGLTVRSNGGDLDLVQDSQNQDKKLGDLEIELTVTKKQLQAANDEISSLKEEANRTNQAVTDLLNDVAELRKQVNEIKTNASSTRKGLNTQTTQLAETKKVLTEVSKNASGTTTKFNTFMTGLASGTIPGGSKAGYATREIIVDPNGKDSKTFFPLVLALPGDAKTYKFCLSRPYHWRPAGGDTIWYPNSKNHHASLELCVKVNSGAWGGNRMYLKVEDYYWTYERTIQDVYLAKPQQRYLVIMVKGGGGKFILEGNNVNAVKNAKIYSKATEIYRSRQYFTKVAPVTNPSYFMSYPCNGNYGGYFSSSWGAGWRMKPDTSCRY